MDLKEYLDEMKDIHQHLLEYVDNENDEDANFTELINQYENMKTPKNQDIFKEFIYLISYVANDHRSLNIIDKIMRILLHYQDQIKQTYSNVEIFKIFRRQKKIILNLFKQGIIKPEKSISNMITSLKYDSYFYPELKDFYTDEQKQEIEAKINEIEDFELKRQTGENDSYICHIIRNDMIEDFVSYINRTNLSLSSTINQSIFETNPFLLKTQPTLIQYASFFGSIQIIKYLDLNNVTIDESTWLYVIHSRNPELIHFLEDSKVKPNPKFFTESIKCHYNEITEYLKEIFYNDYPLDWFNTNFASLKYHNYSYFPKILDKDDAFCIIKYDYINIFKTFLQKELIKVNGEYISFIFF